MVTVRSVTALVVSKCWHLYQMDMYNTFSQVTFVKMSTWTCLKVLGNRSAEEGIVIILVYVDDLLITKSIDQLIIEAKQVSHQKFKPKDLVALSQQSLWMMYNDLPLDDVGKSKKQETVSRNLTEAEYRSMASTVAVVTWLLGLFQELGVAIKTSVLVLCDSKSAIQLDVNPIFHERTKHIEIDFHFIRDKIKARVKLPSLKKHRAPLNMLSEGANFSVYYDIRVRLVPIYRY
ncbi:PREDICTED: uncharacterized protein LOC109235926 [Nicotiana attenuata]|uniref:uncharacterized protein LOC109235926 n=1 Tax=Nicotiana attenuata TaxID=49451 RepID=UPI0009050F6D|nr:PREDICTED: uncharacterized protein LOC109235926 [Nicotiana attenuata]